MRKQPVLVTLFFTFTCITILLVGCGKTGPQGPPGLTGAAGPAGSQGPQGNANVLVDTFTVTNASWIWNSEYGYSTGPGSYTEYFTRYHDQAFSQVTQSALNTGEVLVYFTPFQQNPNQWEPLPYTFLDAYSQYYVNYVFETSVGNVRLHFFYTPNGSAGVTPGNLSTAVIPTCKFKIVVVSGTISTSMNNDHIDKTNYGQVSKYLGL